MLGIQYNDKFYGEFQGPAVSHSQWIGEALAFIKEDAGDSQPIINIFDDIGRTQIIHYARKNGLRDIYIGIPRTLPGHVPYSRSRPRYIVINQDAKRLIAPLHRAAVAKNRQLVSFAENSQDYSIVKTFHSGDFLMIWIYRRQ